MLWVNLCSGVISVVGMSLCVVWVWCGCLSHSLAYAWHDLWRICRSHCIRTTATSVRVLDTVSGAAKRCIHALDVRHGRAGHHLLQHQELWRALLRHGHDDAPGRQHGHLVGRVRQSALVRPVVWRPGGVRRALLPSHQQAVAPRPPQPRHFDPRGRHEARLERLVVVVVDQRHDRSLFHVIAL